MRSASGTRRTAAGSRSASLHAAKGLEWDVVFLPGLTDGALPIVYAQTAEAIEEERRLLYVGLTRARQRLFLSWALARAPGGRGAGSRRGSSTTCGVPGPASAAPRRGGQPGVAVPKAARIGDRWNSGDGTIPREAPVSSESDA